MPLLVPLHGALDAGQRLAQTPLGDGLTGGWVEAGFGLIWVTKL